LIGAVALPEARDGPTGYRSFEYAHSLAEFGTPRHLARCDGWVLERRIGATSSRDATGCYPLFSCRDWSALGADLAELGRELVCVSLVTDPFGRYDAQMLQDCFPDKCIAFKPHMVADLRRPPHEFVSKHHRYYARRALARVDIERCRGPEAHLDEWIALYDTLIARHRLGGIRAFSREAFRVQLAMPGIAMIRARCDGETVGAHLWILQDGVAYSHLAAANARGYELNVAYALYWSALELFAEEARWIDFGAGAGLTAADADGLTQFKRGWASESRPTYFCGRILDRARYQAATAAQGAGDSGYFPAYRAGEYS
jgi:hypothetical protein